MTLPTPDLLAHTACEILEDAAFIFAEPADLAPPEEDPLVVARMPLSGEATGSLLLAVPASIGAEIAANLLGVEPDDPEAESKTGDAVGELLNMIAGELSARCDDGEQRWKFGTPAIAFPGHAEPFPLEPGARSAVLQTDGGDRIWTAIVVDPV